MNRLIAAVLVVWTAGMLVQENERPFTITVEDEQTGRGVPLVELQTVNNTRHFTDSNGIVAFHEPGLMKQRIFFYVKSHGYEFPKDGFGFRGIALDVKSGGNARIKIRRLIVAERLYRITGQGIYRDSVLAGIPPPIKQPFINGQVFGSDSVVNALYRGKYYWFWGDTNRPGYPLGNFQVTGATSELPGKGGLDPSKGVDLTYFVDPKGFARGMTSIPGEGPTWIDGVVTLADKTGRERLFAAYVKVRKEMEIYARGLAVFNEEKKLFEQVTAFEMKSPVHPGGHPFKRTEVGVEFCYFGNPYPLVRVRADEDHLRDLSKYEAFTCLKEGSRLLQPQLDHAPDGSIRYGWKTNTPAVGPKEQDDLIKQGHLKQTEALIQLRDVETGKLVRASSGSVYWNAYRKRWVMITVELFGTSVLGEVWYAEADTPLGPWMYARKVVTHERYSFYNPKQHPLFDQEGGRIVYFEGTYSTTFSGNTEQTPRYDYNQIMYRLNLADPRVVLPVPVYTVSAGELPNRFYTLVTHPDPKKTREVAFFALDRPAPNSVPLYARQRGDGDWYLKVGEPPTLPGDTKPVPVCFAISTATKNPLKNTVPLYEFVNTMDGRSAYCTDRSWAQTGFRRSEEPLCLVWQNPTSVKLR
jgi:hypothetical protein